MSGVLFERFPAKLRRSTKIHEVESLVRAASCNFVDRSCPSDTEDKTKD